ncbi:MAG: hypothetical protein GC151_14735 [Betaproteobacteria bacterium]|nr:hypothetical protein [Betaproteobacteria bacterium]
MAPDHPILGTWAYTFALPDGTCTEVYRFRQDGTTLVTSAGEVAETRYEISTQPDENGFYRLVDTIVKDNGQKDCSGLVMQVGHTATRYLQFDPSGEEFVICEQASLDACFGPLLRVHGMEI